MGGKFTAILCGSVLAGLAAMPASAGDMYSPGYGSLNDSPFLSGFYLGINGGGSFGASQSLAVTNDRDTSQAAIGQFYRHSGFGGGQAGYNLVPFGGRLVLGVEADIQGSGIDSGFTRTLNYGVPQNPAAFDANQTVEYFGTVRGRVGYALGRTLVYGTGGLAYAGVQTKVKIASTAW